MVHYVAHLRSSPHVLAALAESRPGGGLRLRGLVASPDGRRVARSEGEGTDPAALGEGAAEEVLAKGGAEILAALGGPA